MSLIKKEIEKTDLVLSKLKKMIKNPWTPVPFYEFEEIEEEVEKINPEIPENSILIKIGQLNYNSIKTFINISFQYSDTQDYNNFLYHKGDNNFNFNQTLTSDNYYTLSKRVIQINLFKKAL